MKQKHLYIVHGYDASPTSHWFGWLKRKLVSDDVKVDIIKMPTPATPKLEEWLEVLSNSINFDDEVYLVGHSLGCPTILNFLQGPAAKAQISGVLLVNGFAGSIPKFEFLDEFTSGGFDKFELAYEILKNMTSKGCSNLMLCKNGASSCSRA
ncbi:RBBP9/YdeN family alpha/beta hydrolase [Campylobacter curvus]|uniref:RBBP9/YdeN family alpha/beta hydrolase n=1 Tax=Campylobacter curvus TaxID=200 RepID=UPI00146FDF5F|nr:alpha/beta hydrolase [Campylobacter curvus]